MGKLPTKSFISFQSQEIIMRRYMLCAVLGLSAGCADQPAPAPTATAPAADTTAAPESDSSPANTISTVALVKFSCPTMH
jgi:hypothetical protein